MMRLPSRFRDSLYLNAWIRDLKVNLRRDSELIQGMRDDKKNHRDYGIERKLGQNDGIRKHQWGLFMERLW